MKRIDAYRPYIVIAITLVFGLLVPLMRGQHPVWLYLTVGGLVSLADLFFPQTVEPIWNTLKKGGETLSKLVTLFLMAITYVAVIVPFGLAKQIFFRKNLQANRASYYDSTLPKRDPKHMEHPF